MNWIKEFHNSSLVLALTKKKQRQFLLLFFLVVLAILFFKESSPIDFSIEVLKPYLILSIGIGVFMLFPVLIFPVLYLWFLIGRVLSAVVSFVVMFVLYYLILSPIRLIFGKRKSKSGWVENKDEVNFENMY